MYVEPNLIFWFMLGAISICAFMVGFCAEDKKETVIEETIMYLIKNGYLQARKTDSGEWDIIPLEEN